MLILQKISLFVAAGLLSLMLAFDADASQNLSLHHAAWNGNFSKVVQLLDKGADINARDKNGLTPLDYALDSGETTIQPNMKIISLLLERGANVNSRDARIGQTPLHFAATIGNLELISLLLAHGADVNIRDQYGQTPLRAAEHLEQTEAINLLIKHGAQ